MYELTYWAVRDGEGVFEKIDVNMTKHTMSIFEGECKSEFASFIVDDGEMMIVPVGNINCLVKKRGVFNGIKYKVGEINESS